MQIIARKPVQQRGVRFLLALLFIIGTSVFASAVTQHSALAATCAAPTPTLGVRGDEQYAEETYVFDPSVACSAILVPDSHACLSLGTDESQVSAIECTNIYVNTDPSTDEIEIYSVGTYYCQSGTGAVVQCAGMAVETELASKSQLSNGTGGSTSVYSSGTYTCGVVTGGAGACANGSKVPVGTAHRLESGDSQPASCLEAWPIDVGGNTIYEDDVNGLNDYVDSSNFSVAHMNICTPES